MVLFPVRVNREAQQTFFGRMHDRQFGGCAECAVGGIEDFDGAVALDEHDFAAGEFGHLHRLAERLGYDSFDKRKPAFYFFLFGTAGGEQEKEKSWYKRGL